MYNRYIPQNGTYTRVVEQDGPEEEAAGLPRVPWALAAWGTCSQGRRAR